MSADKTLAGRRFHKHARNCTWCLRVVGAEPGSDAAKPSELCRLGKELWGAAVVEARKFVEEESEPQGDPEAVR